MTPSTTKPPHCIMPEHTLATLTASWRAEGAPDDWWQECVGADGAVYDVNIYNGSSYGAGTGSVYCVYPTRVLPSGLRDTVVDEPIARGMVS